MSDSAAARDVIFEAAQVGDFIEITAYKNFPLLGKQRVGRAHIRQNNGQIWVSAH